MTRILSREAINRMVGNSRSAQGSQSSRGGGGGGGQAVSLANLSDVAISTPIDGGSVLIFDETAGKWVAGTDVLTTMWNALSATGTEQIDASHLTGVLGDYATETWVNQNYISIAYFDRLFRAYNGNTLVSHNDETSTIDNIKAMFGFWTEQYLSALGSSGGGSVSLTLANMGDVTLNNLSDGQILVYDATEGKWVNESASIVGNYLPLTGGTLTGDLFFAGYNNRVFGIKRTPYATGAAVGTNIDIGWNWDNKDGAGAFFRSADAGTQAGDFGIFASNANGTEHTLRGKYDGTLTWGNANVLTSANVKTINGQSIYGTGNIEVGGGGTGYLPLTGGTMTGYISLTQGVDIRSGSSTLLVYRPSGIASISSTQWGVGANNSQGVIRSSASELLHWRGTNASGQAYAILDEYNAVDILDDSFLPLSGGTLTGRLTINASVADVLVLNRTSASSVVRMDLAQGGTVYGNLGLDASHNIILRTTSGGTHTVRLQINTNGNVGIGTTSPNYKMHVNGTLGAGNTSVSNLESEGYVSALSDIRKKSVVEYMDGLNIEQIASMPIIKFLWKDRPEEGLQVGSVAQEWQKILPQSVHTTHDGFLSFAESRAALVGTISNSRELVKHDARLSRIEKLLNINID